MPPRPLPSLFAIPLAPILCVPLLCAPLAGCATAPPQDEGYTLRPHASVRLADGATLTYDSYSDSRCPADVRCVWAGRLVLRFVIDGPGGPEEFTLAPDQPVAAPRALHGAGIVLDTAAIPPVRANATVDDLMPVTLKITHNNNRRP